jgi:Tape measure protein
MPDVEPIGISVDPSKAVSGIRMIRDAMKELVAGFKEGYATTMEAEKKIGEPLEKAGEHAMAKGIAIGELLAKGIEKGLDVLKDALKEAMSEESMQIGFSALINNAKEAEEVLKELREFGAGTGVTIPGLEKAAFDMAAAGVSAEHLVGDLKALSNVAAAGIDPTRSLQMLVTTFDRVRETNQLATRQLVELKSAGFDAISAIAAFQQKGTEEVRKEIRDGKIGWDILNAAMLQSTQEGGRYFDLAAERAKTFGGQLEVMKQKTSEMFKDLVGGMLPALNQMLTDFRSLTGEGTVFATIAKSLKDEMQGYADEFSKWVKQVKEFNGWQDFLNAGKLVMVEIGHDLLAALLSAIEKAATALKQLVADAKAGFSIQTNIGGGVSLKYGADPVAPTTMTKSLADANDEGLRLFQIRIAESSAAIQKEREARDRETAEENARLHLGTGKPGEKRDDGLGAPPARGGSGGGGKDTNYKTDYDLLLKMREEMQKVDDMASAGLVTDAERARRTADIESQTLKKLEDPLGSVAKYGAGLNLQLNQYRVFQAEKLRIAKQTDQAIADGTATAMDAVKRGIEKAIGALDTWQTQLEKFSGEAINNLTSGVVGLFDAFVSGSKSAGQAFREFASQFLKQIADMILKLVIANLLKKALESFGGGGFVGGTGDTGPTSDANYVETARSAGSWASGGFVSWQGAPHYSSGGAVPIIAHEGELVLNQAQQKNVADGLTDSKVSNQIAITVVNNHAAGSSQSTTNSNADAQSVALARQLEGEVTKVINNHLRYGGVLSKANPAFAAATS